MDMEVENYNFYARVFSEKPKKSPKKIPVINVKHSAIPPLQEEKRNEGYSPEAHPRKRSDKRSKGNSEVEC